MNSDPTRSLPADPDTPASDPGLDAGLAAAFGPDPAPAGDSHPTSTLDGTATHDPPGQPSAAPPRGAGPRYALLGEIARGGMGVILRATDAVLGREVAVKVLQDRFGPTSAAARRFADEARITGRLQHPGIPPVHDLGTLTDGRPFLAMKLIEGRTLDALLAARPDPSADRGPLVAVVEKVCEAVAYAHSKGVIHRDLKPANIMVGRFGEVQVMDWGLAGSGDRQPTTGVRSGAEGQKAGASDATRDAAPTRSGSPGARGSTQPGAVLGTPAYIPPEQARGEPADRRSDVFGLGAVLCAVLTGKPPFLGSDAATTLALAAGGRVGVAFARLDECPADPELVALCKRCLSPNPTDRPADAAEVAAAVAALRTAADDRARQAELDRAAAAAEAREQRKRRKVQLALAAAVGLLLVGGAAGAWWQDRAEGRRLVAQVKAEAAEVKARDAVEAAIALAADLRARYRYADAQAALSQAAGLLPADAPDDLRDRLARAWSDLAFVADLDQARMRAFTLVASGPYRRQNDEAGALKAYRAAFLARGLDVTGDDPAAVAERVRGNAAIRKELVAALDDWAALADGDGPTRDRVLVVARLADPGDWLDRFRDPAVRRSRMAVGLLARAADPVALAPGTVAALSRLMHRHRLNPGPLLREAQLAHPTDFPIAFTLGQRLTAETPADAREKAACLRAARALRPDDTTVLFNIAFAALGDGRQDAAAPFRQIVRLAPGDAHLHEMAAWVLGEVGHRDAAIEIARTGVRHNPADSGLRAVLGDLLLKQGDHPGAEEEAREAVRLDPADLRGHATLALVLNRQGDLDGAVATLRELVRRDPTEAQHHNYLGYTLCRKGDLDGAVVALREALRLSPKYADAYINLGDVLVLKGDLDGALAALREAIKLDPKLAAAHHQTGAILHKRGDLDGALAALREAARLTPKDARIHFKLGAVLERKGDLDGALAAVRESVRLDPTDSKAQAALGIHLGRKGDLDGALAALREAVRLDPTNALAYHGLGTGLMHKGDLDGAAAALREAVRLNPKDAEARNSLGAVLTRKGDAAGALEVYREAVRLDPRNALARVNLGQALRQQGQPAEALPHLRQGHELGSKRPGWAVPSARLVAECERELAAQEARTAPPPREVVR